MKDYKTIHETIRLDLLNDKLELHMARQKKTGFLQVQKYNEAGEARSKEKTILERLNSRKTTLQEDYNSTDILPSNMMNLVIIDHLLAELNNNDTSLPAKLHVLHQFLYVRQLDAINHDDKSTAEAMANELKQVREAEACFKDLLKTRTFRIALSRKTTSILATLSTTILWLLH